jgi:hypothetical protein
MEEAQSRRSSGGLCAGLPEGGHKFVEIWAVLAFGQRIGYLSAAMIFSQETHPSSNPRRRHTHA